MERLKFDYKSNCEEELLRTYVRQINDNQVIEWDCLHEGSDGEDGSEEIEDEGSESEDAKESDEDMEDLTEDAKPENESEDEKGEKAENNSCISIYF